MATYVVHYFNSAGRATPIRLVFAIAGVPYEDRRFNREEWPAIKTSPLCPYGQVPVLEVKKDGKTTVIAEASAILSYLVAEHGADCGLKRTDPLDVARVEEIRSALDSLTNKIAETMWEPDEDRKKAAREQLAATAIPRILAGVNKRLQPDGYVCGSTITIADLAVAQTHSWLSKGVLDHIPSDIVAPYERILKCVENVKAHPAIKDHPDVRESS